MGWWKLMEDEEWVGEFGDFASSEVTVTKEL
jgi:hypothetical protein